MKKFSSDASAFFNRAVQKTEEVFNIAERTPLDRELEDLIKQCDQRQKWAEGLVSLTENMLQPNPAARVEDLVLKTIDKKRERPTAQEQLGENMIQVGGEIGVTTLCGNSLIRFGELQQKLGQAEKNMVVDANESYVTWLRSFLTQHVHLANAEKSALDNARLDLDSAKNKLRRVKNDPAAQMTLQEEVRNAQIAFNQHTASAKRALEATINEFDQHSSRLYDVVRVQKKYHNSCLEALAETEQQLKSY